MKNGFAVTVLVAIIVLAAALALAPRSAGKTSSESVRMALYCERGLDGHPIPALADPFSTAPIAVVVTCDGPPKNGKLTVSGREYDAEALRLAVQNHRVEYQVIDNVAATQLGIR
jgi:hypothetical protein